MTTRAAWWLLAAGACREAVERLGRLNVAEARAAATEDELAWARGGDGGGNGFGGGGGGGFGGGGGVDLGGGNGFGDGGGFGVGSGSGGGFGDDCIGDGFGDGDRRGDGATSADILSITIDGETMTPAEARERVRQWAE